MRVRGAGHLGLTDHSAPGWGGAAPSGGATSLASQGPAAHQAAPPPRRRGGGDLPACSTAADAAGRRAPTTERTSALSGVSPDTLPHGCTTPESAWPAKE